MADGMRVLLRVIEDSGELYQCIRLLKLIGMFISNRLILW